jgi:hypothetical protein
MLTAIHEFSPVPSRLPARPSTSSSSPSASSTRRASSLVSGLHCDFSTSAFTPAIASVPSEKQTRALPFALGMIPLSATSGRNCVGVRPSGLVGGVNDNEE